MAYFKAGTYLLLSIFWLLELILLLKMLKPDFILKEKERGLSVE